MECQQTHECRRGVGAAQARLLKNNGNAVYARGREMNGQHVNHGGCQYERHRVRLAVAKYTREECWHQVSRRASAVPNAVTPQEAAAMPQRPTKCALRCYADTDALFIRYTQARVAARRSRTALYLRCCRRSALQVSHGARRRRRMEETKRVYERCRCAFAMFCSCCVRHAR